jgi:hypothetical protein
MKAVLYPNTTTNTKCGAYFCYFNLTTFHPQTNIEGTGLPETHLSLSQISSVFHVKTVRHTGEKRDSLCSFKWVMLCQHYSYSQCVRRVEYGGAQWRHRYCSAAVTLGNTTTARRPQPRNTSHICSTSVTVWIYAKLVSVGTRPRTGRNGTQFLAKARDFSLLQKAQTGSGAHLAFLSPGGKWPQCEADLSLPPSAGWG